MAKGQAPVFPVVEGRSMLVILREEGEVIVISEHIRIQVVSVEGGQVKLGISAPREVQVHRVEVYKRIRQKEQLKTSV